MTKIAIYLFSAFALTACTIAQDIASPPRELRASCNIEDATPIAQFGIPQS